jgi:hypothetical protein
MGGDIHIKHSEKNFTIFGFKLPIKKRSPTNISSLDLLSQFKESSVSLKFLMPIKVESNTFKRNKILSKYILNQEIKLIMPLNFEKYGTMKQFSPGN